MWRFITSVMKEFLETYFGDILEYDRRHKWQRKKKVAAG
jgi:phage pi2 protein 07